jgi:hypothetical protein
MQRKPSLDGAASAPSAPSGRVPPFAISIDPIADAALQTYQTTKGALALHCDNCGEVIEGEPSGRGLYMWTRGEERRFEEPALCTRCSVAIGVTALNAWSVEEEEG